MSERASTGLYDTVVDRTLGKLRNMWREIATSTRGVLSGVPRADLPDDDVQRLRQQMHSCLDGSGGEVSARARAAELGRTYLALNQAGRERFLHVMAEDFDIDREAVDRWCTRLAAAKAPAERVPAERGLRAALTAPRVRLLRQFNALPEGVKFLVDRRAELIALADGDSAMRGLADDLRELLADWFDIGFLELRRISWESSAALLEKLIAYEAVHEIRGWNDLKNRLEADRRCFAFFHPRMPDEPLIFVEVALVKGIAGDIHALLDESAPLGDANAADTAIFYSISNCQRGLNGISLGDFLIKRVVELLAAELPRLKTFSTLSPIPGFRAWLNKERERLDLLLPGEAKALAAVVGNGTTEPDLLAALDRPGWHTDAALSAALRDPLLRLCAQYLVVEKGRPGRAADPVAHFHLTNGARVERLNWLGDTSEKGLQQAAGLMVNYLYRLDHIEANHEAYRGEGRVAASSAVRRLMPNR
ncbi:MAG TPA: malonyl-CoA decarboxylase [Stellaceae bacterium]|nr:malonyl-CoA decarboxylase [Stellaceae bacterium]